MPDARGPVVIENSEHGDGFPPIRRHADVAGRTARPSGGLGRVRQHPGCIRPEVVGEHPQFVAVEVQAAAHPLRQEVDVQQRRGGVRVAAIENLFDRPADGFGPGLRAGPGGNRGGDFGLFREFRPPGRLRLGRDRRVEAGLPLFGHPPGGGDQDDD